MKNSISVAKNTSRLTVLASVMVFGIAGVFHAQNSTAGSHDSSMSGQSGQSGSAAGGSSSGQGSATSGYKGSQQGSQHKKHGSSEHGASKKDGSSRGEVNESKQTGVTGDTPSGGRSETSGQERGPSGY